MSQSKHSGMAISELSCASVSKRVFVQNLSYENKFDLHLHENPCIRLAGAPVI